MVKFSLFFRLTISCVFLFKFTAGMDVIDSKFDEKSWQLKAEQTITFSYTGSSQTWVVPSGVTSITATAYGAAGGTGCYDGLSYPGGTGGAITSTLTVTSGSTLYIYVGGAGLSSTMTTSYAVAGGFNGTTF